MFKSRKKGQPKGFLLGGPAYQNQVDSRHAGAMGSLAVRLTQLGYRTGFAWIHACPVEMARNELMRIALAEENFHWLVSADADIFWPPEQQDAIVWVAQELTRLDAPFAAVPVAQRNGAFNVVPPESPGFERPTTNIKLVQELQPCKAIGTGLFVARLKWYRENWPEGPWFRTEWGPSGRDFVGEDFWHCVRLAHGGRSGTNDVLTAPYSAPVMQLTHAIRGKL